MNNTLNAYNNSREALKNLGIKWLQPIKSEKITLSCRTLDNQQAWQAIKDFAPQQGWLQTLDQITLIQQANTPLPEQDSIICGEMVNGSQSLHLRPANANQILLIEFIPGKGKHIYLSAGSSHYIQHPDIKDGTLKAHYQLYWHAQNSRQPQIACFRGFTRSQK